MAGRGTQSAILEPNGAVVFLIHEFENNFTNYTNPQARTLELFHELH